MLELTKKKKKMVVQLLTGTVCSSIHIKYMLLSNQKFMTQPNVINIHPNEYSLVLHYYPFAINLDRCVRSCNTLND